MQCTKIYSIIKLFLAVPRAEYNGASPITMAASCQKLFTVLYSTNSTRMYILQSLCIYVVNRAAERTLLPPLAITHAVWPSLAQLNSHTRRLVFSPQTTIWLMRVGEKFIITRPHRKAVCAIGCCAHWNLQLLKPHPLQISEVVTARRHCS